MTKVGMIGCGTISGIYLKPTRISHPRHHRLCRHRPRPSRSRGGKQSRAIADILAHPDIDIIVNLTIPAAHAEVAQAAIAHSKSVSSEKPLALNDRDGNGCSKPATAGVRVGCAPDTFLGGGYRLAASSSTTAGSAHRCRHRLYDVPRP